MKGSLLISANMWLLAALTLFIGGKVVRTEPVMYSFFDVGAWLYPDTYHTLIGLCIGAALLCFVFLLRGSPTPANDRLP